MIKKRKISKILEKRMKQNREIGICCTFRTRDFWNIQGVINETLDDFIIFENGGGKAFEIWTKENIKGSVKLFANALKKRYPHSIFMYKHKGKEFIVNDLPRNP